MTAEKKRSIFRQESIDQVESPEKLDQMLRVSRPSAWAVVIALVVLAVSVLVWGFTGRLPQTVEAQGFTAGGVIFCFLPTDEYDPGMSGCSVNVSFPDGDIVSGKLETPEENSPQTTAQIRQSFKDYYGGTDTYDWIFDQILTENYMYYAVVEPDEEHEVPEDEIIQVSASIIVKEVAPVTYVLN